MTISILGLGTAVPAHTMSQAEAEQLATTVCGSDEQKRRILKVLYRKSGVQNRYTCIPHETALAWLEPTAPPKSATLHDNENAAAVSTKGPTTAERMHWYEEHAFPLSLQSASTALRTSGISNQEITHLVTISCTGFYSPGIDLQLMRQLGLPNTTQRVHIGFMGCHAALNGLRVCEGIGAAHPEAKILLCAVELCCLHYWYPWNPERFLGNALFADGAAALVLGSNGHPQGTAWQLVATGSNLIPDSSDAMSWRIGDFGFEMTLGSSVPDQIKQHLPAWLSSWLHQHGTRIEDIGCWAVHPGGPRVLSAVEESLQLPVEALTASRGVLEEFGNMSSPTVLFIVQRLLEHSQPSPCVLLGFGPGLVAEVALLR